MRGWSYARLGKRSLDLTLAVPAIFLLVPVMLIVAIVILFSMGRPVFFRQTRPGVRKRLFTVLKFRTMRNVLNNEGRPLADSLRLTPLGSWLRRSSLDELPELWNVLRGEMSLIGPRPLLIKYLPHYTEREQMRFEVRPGITGWAQVNGRNDSPWDDRLEHDAWYVENLSLALDARILLRTVGQVLARRGAHAAPREHLLDLDEERREPDA